MYSWRELLRLVPRLKILERDVECNWKAQDFRDWMVSVVVNSPELSFAQLRRSEYSNFLPAVTWVSCIYLC